MVEFRGDCFLEDWKKIFKRLLPCVDFLLPSIEETFLLRHPDKYKNLRDEVKGEIIDHIDTEIFRSISSEFLEFGCGSVMLKAGSQGLYFRTGEKSRLSECSSLGGHDSNLWSNLEIWCPAIQPQKIVSTTATGDICIAGFLSAMISGANPIECLLTGALSASLKMSKTAIADALPSIDTCLDMIRKRKILPAQKSLGNRFLGQNWNLDSDTNTFSHKCSSL